jgi:hypothetical protein
MAAVKLAVTAVIAVTVVIVTVVETVIKADTQRSKIKRNS